MPSQWEQYESKQYEHEIESRVDDLTQQLLSFIQEKTNIHPRDKSEIEGDFHSIESTIDQLADDYPIEFVREVIKRLKNRWHDYMDKHLENQNMMIVEFLENEIKKFSG